MQILLRLDLSWIKLFCFDARELDNFALLLLRRTSPVMAHSGADLMRRHVRSWRKQTNDC
jgi:hypothetical protein